MGHQHTDAEVTDHRPDEITQEAEEVRRERGGPGEDPGTFQRSHGRMDWWDQGWGHLAGEVRPEPWGVHGLEVPGSHPLLLCCPWPGSEVTRSLKGSQKHGRTPRRTEVQRKVVIPTGPSYLGNVPTFPPMSSAPREGEQVTSFLCGFYLSVFCFDQVSLLQKKEPSAFCFNSRVSFQRRRGSHRHGGRLVADSWPPYWSGGFTPAEGRSLGHRFHGTGHPGGPEKCPLWRNRQLFQTGLVAAGASWLLCGHSRLCPQCRCGLGAQAS